MCYLETRHFNCGCPPATINRNCLANPHDSAQLCHFYEVHSSYPEVPCSECNPAVWATPPSSPSRISQLKDVFESHSSKNAAQPVDGARGLGHRRGSVGRLEDKCQGCRLSGLECDMKRPRCTNCLGTDMICETTRQWLARMSGKASPPSPQLGNAVGVLPPKLYIPRSENAVDNSLGTGGGEVYTAQYRATEEGLKDLKKNMRGLRAALKILGSNKQDPREMIISKVDPNDNLPEQTFSPPDFQEIKSPKFDFLEPANSYMDWISDPPHTTTLTTTNDEESPSSSEGLLVSPDLDDDWLRSPGIFEDNPPLEVPIMEPDPGPPYLERDAEYRHFQTSLDELTNTSRKVRTAAQNAYKKLKSVARSRKTSAAFRRFVQSLRSLDNILTIGSQTYEMLIDQETPRSLDQIYCFLHFAYAMSQGDTDLLPKSNKVEYQTGLAVFRSCLPSTLEYGGVHSERNIFDEIASHMADELACALRWAKKQNLTPTSFQGLTPEGILRLHSERGDHVGGVGSVSKPGTRYPTNITDATTLITPNLAPTCATGSWGDIRSLRVFKGVSRFLAGLSRFGSPFKLFSGEFCKSIASGGYKHLIYSKSYRERFELSHADEMQKRIRKEVISKFDRSLIADDSLLQALETALEMVDLGSLITLEDYVDYARGLLMAMVMPIHVLKRFEEEITHRTQQLAQKLPRHLCGRVKWAELFIPLEVADLSPDVLVATPCPAENIDILVNMAQADVSMAPGPYDPVDIPTWSPGSEDPDTPLAVSPADAMDYITYTTPQAPYPSSSPDPSTPSSTPPSILSDSSSADEEGDSPISPTSIASPVTIFTCPTCNVDITNKSNLTRHMRTKHGGNKDATHGKRLKCPIPGCKTTLGSARAKENMRTHLKNKHGVERPGMEEVRWRVDMHGRQ
ncbi:hypothetical protein DRE_04663 [Drechslerella stenobrocha 248]|uniref:C2H2-type domain-containing protein n=1 Tax=Drechslerella stenobrocha 248 TaxID=1043628 RepID=W7HSA9_9PEZI|nr:hypothetical protein DRE_04663 [Drechslerella stenobrocha 248]